MKLKCIKSCIGVTEGNIYEVIENNGFHFKIIEDDNELGSWSFVRVKGRNGGFEPYFIELIEDPKVESITIPIEDYNRLRKFEIKQEIKRLRKEYKSL